jgi:hypothetical protein
VVRLDVQQDDFNGVLESLLGCGGSFHLGYKELIPGHESWIAKASKTVDDST